MNIANIRPVNILPTAGQYLNNSQQESLIKFSELSQDFSNYINNEINFKINELSTQTDIENFLKAKFDDWENLHNSEIDIHMNFVINYLDTPLDIMKIYHTNSIYKDLKQDNTEYKILGEDSAILFTNLSNGKLIDHFEYKGKLTDIYS